MKDNRVIIPNVNLKKFYRICAFQKVSHESINLKEKTFRRYIRLRDDLFEGGIKAETYSIFIDELRKSILSNIISEESLNELINKPLNPSTIKILFEEKGQEISNSSAKALLSLLIKVYLIDQINIIKNISIDEENDQDKELIYYYLLRRRDFISVKELNFFLQKRKIEVTSSPIKILLSGEMSSNQSNLDLVPKRLGYKIG